MNKDLHARAEKLIAQERVEGISRAERDWLTGHLRECVGCGQVAQQISEALRTLRGMNISLPHGLAERTQFRVQLRAQEMREREPRRGLLWTICGVSWGIGIASAPYVWQAIEWVGQRTGAPKLLLEFGFGLWWAIPALFAAAIVVLENLRQANERDGFGR